MATTGASFKDTKDTKDVKDIKDTKDTKDIKDTNYNTSKNCTIVLEALPISDMKVGNHNTTNVYAYWNVDSQHVIHISKSFYENALTPKTREWLLRLSKTNPLKIEDDPFVVFKENFPKEGTTEGKIWDSLYKMHWEQFGFEQWGAAAEVWLRHSPFIISTNSYERKAIETFALKRLNRLNESDNVNELDNLKEFEEDHPRIWKCLKAGLNKYPRAFIKTGQTSGKNECAPVCVTTPFDCLNVLTRNREIIKRGFDYIIIQPWYDELKGNTEWRVFVKDGKVTVITQQQPHVVFDTHTPTLVTQVASKIISFVQSMESLWKQIGMSTVVMDVWVLSSSHNNHNNNYNNTDYQVSLIELNPWILSGTGTFEWKADMLKIEGIKEKNNVYVRYLV
jgi:hypothetical protein